MTTFPEYPIETAAMEALKFLQRLATEDGAIVSSGICTALEISQARLENRFFVDHEGLGYILRSQKLRHLPFKKSATTFAS
jgi:hypothetical protein